MKNIAYVISRQHHLSPNIITTKSAALAAVRTALRAIDRLLAFLSRPIGRAFDGLMDGVAGAYPWLLDRGPYTKPK